MKKVVVDSSVIIDFLRTGGDVWNRLVERAESGEIVILVPSVVVSELWSGRSMNEIKEVTRINRLLELTRIVLPNLDEVKLVGKIKRNFGVSIADAMVAACALSNKAYLSTLNTKHFEKVKGLKLL